MALLLAAVIGLVALIVTPGYLFYFDVTPKIVALLAGCSLVLVCTGTLRPAHKLFSLLLLLDAISLALSAAFSAHPALSAFGTNWRRFGAAPQAAIFLFAWLVSQHTAGRPERVRTILRGVAAAGAVTALYGILQYFGWDPILPAAAYHIGEGVWTIVRPPGTLGYVSYFATWLLAVAFFSLALSALETSPVWRKLAYVASVLAVVAMFLTGTRAAVFGLAAGAGVWLYGSGFRISRRMMAAAALILVAGAGFYFSPLGGKLRSRSRWFVEDPWGGARPTLWRDSLRMAVARPLAGYGPEVFTAAFPHFESKALAEAYPDFSHESPHNIFLDSLISQGIPGLAILCALCVLGLKKPRTSPALWIAAAIAAAIAAQQFTVFIVPTALIFYTMIALALSLGAAVNSPEPRRSLPFTIAAAPAALALVYLALRFTLADQALALTRRSVESADLHTAVAHYAQYQRWRLPGTSADLWYSRSLLNLAMKESNPLVRYQAVAESGAAAVRATQIAEDPFDAWYNMAQLYAGQNDLRRTESSLRSAIAASPNWFKPHWALAQLLHLSSRRDEAEREAAIAAELDAGKNPEVALTLSQIRAR